MNKEKLGTIKDKITIITGGSRGLGRNTALNLARRGVNIIFTYYTNQAEADSLLREIEGQGRKAAAFRLDTGDIRSTREHCPRRPGLSLGLRSCGPSFEEPQDSIEADHGRAGAFIDPMRQSSFAAARAA